MATTSAGCSRLRWQTFGIYRTLWLPKMMGIGCIETKMESLKFNLKMKALIIYLLLVAILVMAGLTAKALFDRHLIAAAIAALGGVFFVGVFRYWKI